MGHPSGSNGTPVAKRDVTSLLLDFRTAKFRYREDLQHLCKCSGVLY